METLPQTLGFQHWPPRPASLFQISAKLQTPIPSYRGLILSGQPAGVPASLRVSAMLAESPTLPDVAHILAAAQRPTKLSTFNLGLFIIPLLVVIVVQSLSRV